MFLLSMLLAAADPVAATAQVAAPAPAPAAAHAVSEDGFTTGVDTIQTVTAKLGKPNASETNSDGTVTIHYVSIHTHVKGASFIPVVGLFAGGATGKSASKSFTFGSDGFLKSFGTGNTQTTCNSWGGCH